MSTESHPQPNNMVLVPLGLIQRAQQAINWHLEPNSPAEHNATMLELSAIGWPGSVPPVKSPAPAPEVNPKPVARVTVTDAGCARVRCIREAVMKIHLSKAAFDPRSQGA